MDLGELTFPHKPPPLGELTFPHNPPPLGWEVGGGSECEGYGGEA